MRLVIASLFVSLLSVAASAAPVVGEAAPAFSGRGSNGESVSLADFAGKTVILEWTNDQCPYVRKHYESNNMQTLQTEAAGEGVVWISIISSAPGKQGHVAPDEANALSASRGASPSHVVLDETGAIGRLYDAKTTPHMFIIDGTGTLVYAGGIDDKPTTRVSDIEGATNYVRLALAEMKAGQPVSVPGSTPYGCSIKYAE